MWKRFNFFSLERVSKEEGRGEDGVSQKTNWTCSTSGRGSLIFGDRMGWINICDATFNIGSFAAFKQETKLVHQCKHSNILLALGTDDEGVSPTLKIWNLDKTERSGNPLCIRTVKIAKTFPATSLAVLEDLSQVAVGMCDGSLVILTNLVPGDRQPKQQTIIVSETQDPITGLEFAIKDRAGSTSYQSQWILYASTISSVTVMDTAHQYSKIAVDNTHGCDINLSCLNDEQAFVVGSPDAVHFYYPDLNASKPFPNSKMIKWFREYLIVVSPDTPLSKGITGSPLHGETVKQNQIISIYDLRNQFQAFQQTTSPIVHLVSEWGSIYFITNNGDMYQLTEKDLKTKLDKIMSRSLYMQAVVLAKSKNYDEREIANIFRIYGDDLYNKEEYNGAIMQYIKTIGALEPSYVIRKFLGGDRILNLTQYLQALHQKGLATSDHTTLLLNCYTKLKDTENLKKFIENSNASNSSNNSAQNKGLEVKFEVGTAIAVCRGAGYYDHALYLAKKHNKHEIYVKILLEDLKDYDNALEYISMLDFYNAELNLKRYGQILVSHRPDKTTKLLMSLCTVYKPKPGLDISSNTVPVGEDPTRNRAVPEEFIHIYVKHPEWLTFFLEFIQKNREASAIVYNTLLELYLRDDTLSLSNSTSKNNNNNNSGNVGELVPVKEAREERLEKALNLLKDPRAKFDEDHALVLTKTHDFKQGIIHLYDKLGLYSEIVQFYIENGDNLEIVKACKKYGATDPELWITALGYFAERQEQEVHAELGEILDHIEKENLLQPLVVIRTLSKNDNTKLDVIKDYVTRKIAKDENSIAEDKGEIDNQKHETNKIRNEVMTLKTRAVDFQNQKCSGCRNAIELPSVNFMCYHSFHEGCLPDNETECPKCAEDHKKWSEIKRSFETSAGEHDKFYKQLDVSAKNEGDGFGVVAKYFGRGVMGRF